jgi:hypothetical protein
MLAYAMAEFLLLRLGSSILPSPFLPIDLVAAHKLEMSGA